MARFQNSLALVPFPRSLVDDVAHALLDVLEKASPDDDGADAGADVPGSVRLVEGEHLTAGARYRIVLDETEETDGENIDADLKVVSWNRAGESQVEIKADVEGHVVNVRADLRMAGRRLHTLRVEGDYRGAGPLRMLQRATWEAEVCCEDWWASLGPRTAPPISLRVKHPIASAAFLVGRGEDDDGRWSVRSTLRLRGRWIARPLAAVGLLFMRSRIRRILANGFDRTETAWNSAVPGMVERGLQERVTVQHQVEVKSVSREWVEDYVAALHRHIGELRVENGRLTDTSADIRLLEGEHIRPGARYRVALEANNEAPQHNETAQHDETAQQDETTHNEAAHPNGTAQDDEAAQHTKTERKRRSEALDVSVTAWGPDGLSRIEFSGPENAYAGWAELDSAEKPALLRAAFDGEIEEITRLKVTAEGDLERWWTDVSRSGDDGTSDNGSSDDKASNNSSGNNSSGNDRPAMTLKVEQPLGEGVFSIAGSPAEDDRWKLDVSFTAEGHGWARPLIAVAGLLSGAAIQETFASTTDEAATDWDDTVSKAIEAGPNRAAKATLHRLLNEPAAAAKPD